METHYPIDLVIFLLGTNDLQNSYNRSVQEVGMGMRQLIKTVHESDKGPMMTAPKVLIISPTTIINIPNLYPQFKGEGVEKSKALAKIYQNISLEENCEFLDAASFIESSQVDGFHLDESACLILGQAVYQKVMQIFLEN